MNLISKIKKISICSLLSVGTLMSAGSIGLSATNFPIFESDSQAPSSRVALDYVFESMKKIDRKPIIIYVPENAEIHNGMISVFMPQEIVTTKGRDIVYVPGEIEIIGKLIVAHGHESNRWGKPVVAYANKKINLSSGTTEMFVVPQLVEIDGSDVLSYLPQLIKFVGMPVHAKDVEYRPEYFAGMSAHSSEENNSQEQQEDVQDFSDSESSSSHASKRDREESEKGTREDPIIIDSSEEKGYDSSDPIEISEDEQSKRLRSENDDRTAIIDWE